jgi:plastocyanin
MKTPTVKPGDTIRWEDPDEGLLSKAIRYIGDDSAHIRCTDGWESDVLTSELEIIPT